IINIIIIKYNNFMLVDTKFINKLLTKYDLIKYKCILTIFLKVDYKFDCNTFSNCILDISTDTCHLLTTNGSKEGFVQALLILNFEFNSFFKDQNFEYDHFTIDDYIYTEISEEAFLHLWE